MILSKLKKVKNGFDKVRWDLRYILSAYWRLGKLVFEASKKGHLVGLLKHCRRVMHQNITNILIFVEKSKEFGDLDSPSLRVLRERSSGLHSLLPGKEKFKYSILIPTDHPQVKFLEKAVRSALSQSAPFFEVLLGLSGEQSPEVNGMLQKLSQDDLKGEAKLRVFDFSHEQKVGYSQGCNFLAEQATGDYLLVLGQADWIAPDFLFRYEQGLRLHRSPQKLVLYCHEYQMNNRDEPILDTQAIKPDRPEFPYFFVDTVGHGKLIPRTLWQSVGGYRSQCEGSEDYDLCLRLDAAGAYFQNLPFYLYAWRSTVGRVSIVSEAAETQAGIKALQDYAASQHLDWTIKEGYFRSYYRAIPRLKRKSVVHVIIPYKDQKELTIKAVKSVLCQRSAGPISDTLLSTGFEIRVTAVDNRSTDRSIQLELLNLGVEVIDLDEPFNYSRINNIAVHQSRFASQVESLFFLNNDVELKEGAIEEMLRWVDQPRVGLVGARLHFPEHQRLQHGGVMLSTQGPMDRMTWSHVDVNFHAGHQGFSKVITVCDAVTAACLLVKREVFLKAGGFDEVWYPIAFSDTDLAVRVRRLGLVSLYTPYAWGVHYESASRGPGVHEVPEGSHWLFRATAKRDVPQEKLKHPIFS